MSNNHWDLNKIQSEAYRQVEEIRGAADAKATEIYALAYNKSDTSREFYEFTRTMGSYNPVIGKNATIVVSTNSDLFKFLKGMAPNGDQKLHGVPDKKREDRLPGISHW